MGNKQIKNDSPVRHTVYSIEPDDNILCVYNNKWDLIAKITFRSSLAEVDMNIIDKISLQNCKWLFNEGKIIVYHRLDKNIMYKIVIKGQNVTISKTNGTKKTIKVYGVIKSK